MKITSSSLFKWILSLGILGIAFFAILSLAGAALSLYGLYLAFSASFWLGVVVFFVEPSPLIIGIAMFFFEKNLAQALLDYLNN